MVLTSSASVGLLGQQLLDLLGEVSLGAPHQADHAQHHEHCDEAEPERLLEHALAQADDVGGRVWDLTSKWSRYSNEPDRSSRYMFCRNDT